MTSGVLKFRKKSEDAAHETPLILALCSTLFIPSMNNFINCILQTGLNIDLGFLTPISYIFMAFCSVFMLYKHILRKRAIFIFSCLILFGGIFSYFVYPEIRETIYASPVDLVYSSVNKLFYFCIPAMIGIAAVDNYDELWLEMKKWSRVTLVIGIFTFIFVCLIKGATMQYMVYSYFMLTATCVCYIGSAESRKTDIVLAIIGSVCIVACGARGAVISLLLFFGLLCFSAFTRKMTRKNMFLLMVIVLVLFVFIFFYNAILEYFINFFYQLGIESRFLTSIINGTLMESSGRGRLFEVIIEAVKRNPFGYGLYGDRYVLLSGNRTTYAHNFFFEIFCDLGIVFGPLFIIFFVWRMIKSLSVFKSTSVNRITIALIPYGFFQLFFSSSFLDCTMFFMLMGIFFFVSPKGRDGTKVHL